MPARTSTVESPTEITANATMANVSATEFSEEDEGCIQTLKAYQVGDYDIVAAYTPEGAITVLCEQTGWPREDHAQDKVQLVSDTHLDSLKVFNQDEGKTEKLETSLRQDVEALDAPAYMYGWE